MANLKEIIEKLLENLSSRQKEIIEERFGLKGRKLTLAAIGKKYGLTRERIRQIEAAVLKLIKKELEKSEARKIIEKSLLRLKKIGGVRKEENFINDLKILLKDNGVDYRQIRFIFEVAGNPRFHRNDKNFYNFWHLDEDSFKRAVDLINKLEKFFSGKKEKLLAASYGFKNPSEQNYVSISKKFRTNPFGQFGLTKWEEIHPKTMRSKAYLIIKKHKSPLHFREITKKINEAKFNGRSAFEATVHNELIKDPRFVLVGRGMYGLAELGHQPGIAKEVIQRILKNKGPLRKEEVVNLVKQERFLKDNTILLNLQNKKHFKKLPDGRYHLA
ncbi:MAG: RNA polymerase sigma factor [Candidatus Wolfebacteria bacterium GW2011_GWA2_42_10]|uniref:RNA polymerase sigma factor n=2 Tax=Candidatus Wolfeibacteriota TaxID=1752735 RepID=A0A0G0XJP8_9BACT|nr:MAG: RNA polymerase sigma factor [Candidatus Wolfebacteria bacterium GW2011_GWB1_41_12]KKS25099.1 MAG: RNA polymerase sigma factor [Candidatus Wolfebacteria bacterium GW2011_GWA2_42_10]KKT56334.1 MAG: RNA polymerase sigma factor [Candidatus Wolfebacteria bacterium GW2011_GWA1_44_24]